MSLFDSLRERLAAMPLDRAPLRRAGLLTVLLVVLIAIMQTLAPARPARTARQTLQDGTEEVSARSGSGRGTAVLVLLLLAGGGAALVWRRRGTPALALPHTLEVLETQTLGPGQALRLVACGHEVLLLSATAEGVRLLRHWPREAFERGAASLAGDEIAEAFLEPSASEPSASEPSASEPSASEPSAVLGVSAPSPQPSGPGSPGLARSRGSRVVSGVGVEPSASRLEDGFEERREAPVEAAAPRGILFPASEASVAETPRLAADRPSQFSAAPAGFADVLRQFQQADA